VYVGLASNGDCPLTQGKLFKIDGTTGAVQDTFNVVPDGCTGGGLWGSPTIDAADDAIYVVSGNPDPATGSCTGAEPNAQAMLKLSASTLTLEGSWQQNDPASLDHDFGSTPTLFDATIGGVHRSLVGAVNKNGVFYAFDRSNVAAGPVWTYRVADTGASPEEGQGAIAPAAFDGTSLYIGGGQLGSCPAELAALDPATGIAQWSDCVDGPIIGGVAEAPGLLAVGAGPNLEVFSSSTGIQLRTPLYDGDPAWYFSVPTISNGKILIAKTTGLVEAFAPGP